MAAGPCDRSRLTFEIRMTGNKRRMSPSWFLPPYPSKSMSTVEDSTADGRHPQHTWLWSLLLGCSESDKDDMTVGNKFTPLMPVASSGDSLNDPIPARSFMREHVRSLVPTKMETTFSGPDAFSRTCRPSSVMRKSPPSPSQTSHGTAQCTSRGAITRLRTSVQTCVPPPWTTLSHGATGGWLALISRRCSDV